MARRVRLADLTDLITKGTTPTTLGYDFASEGVLFLRAQNLQNGELDTTFDALYVSEATHNALERSQIRSGDVLMSIAGTIGRASVVHSDAPPMNCNQAVAIVRPITTEIDRRYLLRWLESADAKTQIQKSQVTATISNLSLSQIANLAVPLPSLDEQRRIATILDQADALRRKRRCAINHFKSLSLSILNSESVRSADNTTLSQLGDVIMGQSPPGDSYNEDGSGVPLLNGPTEFGERFPAAIQWTNAPTKKCQLNDILFCVRGATAGRLNIADEEYCIGRGLAAIRPKNPKLLDYLYLVLQASYSSFQALGVGSTFININGDQIRNFALPALTDDAAIELSKKLNYIETIKKKGEAQLQKLDQIFLSLQAQFFNSEKCNLKLFETWAAE